jgi:hypothetical protein
MAHPMELSSVDLVYEFSHWKSRSFPEPATRAAAATDDRLIAFLQNSRRLTETASDFFDSFMPYTLWIDD